MIRGAKGKDLKEIHVLIRRTVVFALCSVAALLLAGGCTIEARKAKHTRNAEEYLADGKLDRAEIELLNVLKLDPKAKEPVGKLGAVYFEQGQLGRALPYLARAITLDAHDLASRAKLASLLLSVGNRSQAEIEAEKLLEQDPVNPEALVILAECASSPDEMKKVMDRLDAGGAAMATSAAAWVAKGIILARQGSVVEARSALKRSTELNGNFAPAYAALAALDQAANLPAEAEAALAKAASIAGPRSPRTLQYALFKARSGDTAGARAILDEVIRKAPDYVPAVLRLADLMAAGGQFADAEKILEPILLREPNHPEALLVRSRIYLAQGRVDKAGADVDLLVRMYPKSHEAHYEAARVYVAKHDVARALDSLHLAIESNPEFWDAIVLEARLRAAQGDTAVAVKLLTGMLAKNPGHAEGLRLLVDTYRAQSNPVSALEACDRLEAFHPGQEATAVLRGQILRQMQRPAEARAAFEDALVRNPDSVQALDELVILDVQDKHMDQAVTRVEAAIARRPDVVGLRVTLGKLNLIRGDAAKAEEQFQQGLALNPDLILAHVFLARLYLDTGRQEAAIASLEEVVRRNPRDESAAMLLASLHEKRGDFVKARNTYENLLREVPNSASALNNLACLLQAHTQELERAYELARRARELQPGDANVADTLGWILYQKVDYKLALSPLRESAVKSPGSAQARYRLGAALYMLGEEREAAAELARAVKGGLTGRDAADAAGKAAILALRVEGGRDTARTALQAHLAVQPADPMALITRADIAFAEGRLEPALQDYQAAVTASSQNGLAWIGKGRVERALGNPAKAMESAREARRLMPENVDALVLLGRVAMAAGDLTWANTLLQDAFRRLPADPGVALDAAWAAYSQGQIGDALRAFAVVLARASTPELVEEVELIRAQGRSPQPAPVVATARARLSRKPDDVPALMVVAGAGDRDEAMGALEAVLKRYPAFAPAKRDLALLLFRQGNADRRVMQLASQALEVFPADATLVKTLGVAAVREGQYQVALPLIERVVEGNRDDGELWYYLGLARQKTGGGDSARSALEKSLQLGGLSSEQAKDASKRLEELGAK